MRCVQRLLPAGLSVLCLLVLVTLVWIQAAEAERVSAGENEQASVAAGDTNESRQESRSVHHDEPGHGNGHAAAGGHQDLGLLLPLWSCIPFAGMLLSIALFPLLAGDFWHQHFAKVSFFWAGILGVPFTIAFGSAAVYEILHILLADYVPFIILLWSLYTVSGGILIRGSLRGTPLVNTLMLVIGTALASWMGTTGAAMLMIRPFLRANDYRKNRTFMVVFFIFLVANIGGSLTPLGDPPLFLGFLHGVSFFWTTTNLLPQMLLVVLLLLAVYFGLDSYFYHREGHGGTVLEDGVKEPLKIEGSYNFLFLGGVVGAVLMSGTVHWGDVNTFGVHRPIQDWVRDGLMVFMGICSLLATPRRVREDNEFTWFPILEVGYLFIGIFITMIPCLLLLKAGSQGSLAFLMNMAEQPHHYYWMTGVLSAFLDNAPTYLTFFNSAAGAFCSGCPEPEAVSMLMHEKALYLQAISAGAVFFGAFSYIGNAPNFMVRSIAEEAGTPMPSFFGYMIKYSLIILIPCFVVVTLIFF